MVKGLYDVIRVVDDGGDGVRREERVLVHHRMDVVDQLQVKLYTIRDTLTSSTR